MQLIHDGRSPQIDSTAFVAPDATVCGDVTIGAGARVMHGARVVAEGGAITIGENVIVMQNAVVRATATHDCRIGASVLIGPGAHVVGAHVEDEVFLATGTSIFHASRIGTRSVVRINGIVHVNSRLAPETQVPIGWVCVGDPAEMFSPHQADEIWNIQKGLNFPLTAYGLDQPLHTCMAEATATVSDRLAAHLADGPID